jgi:hypothetical protein
MLYLIVILFALAAIVGVVILKNWLTAINTARSTIYLHGILAAVPLVLLLLYYVRNPEVNFRNSLVLFGVAALVGFYMFFREIKGKFSPAWMAIAHGLVAVAGLLFLIINLVE